jgi:hypothetical protein
MNTNKELWNRVSKTDPKHVKPITGKQYSGNSPKPYYIVERLTEEFGPCGKGWGFSVLNERFERFSDTDSLHVALVEFWYEQAGERYSFQQMGQTKASYVTGSGKFMLDEDAPKKSVTDALVKCASYLGFAGDIFSGRWDDSKYVADLKKEFAEPREEPTKAPGIKATDGIENHLAEQRRAELDELTLHLIDLKNDGKSIDAIQTYYAIPDNDEKVYVWKQLAKESKFRAEIKANSPHAKKEPVHG